MAITFTFATLVALGHNEAALLVVVIPGVVRLLTGPQDDELTKLFVWFGVAMAGVSVIWSAVPADESKGPGWGRWLTVAGAIGIGGAELWRWLRSYRGN